jgi:glycosyltransferase involved in cell wall biosynthesis
MLRVSVVTPTRRHPALLDRCLQSLAVQTLSAETFEVIVVDDGSDRRTRRQVEEWGARMRPAVRYVAGTGRGPAAARNAGWRAALGGVIAFTDDDCVPTPDWLKAGLVGLADGAAAAGGRVVKPFPRRPSEGEWDGARLDGTGFAAANCFCRREALAAVGGFDERFRLPWRDDSDLQFKLLVRFGEKKVVCLDDAVVLQPAAPPGWGEALRRQRSAMFNALLYKNHPRLYRERIQSKPPWRYYLIAAALASAGALAAAGRPDWALPPLWVWAWHTGRLCGERLAGASGSFARLSELLIASILVPPLAVFWRLAGAVRFRVMFL